MQSEAGNLSSTQQLSVKIATPAQGVVNSSVSKEVLKSMNQSGETPLDWVRNNLKPNEPALVPTKVLKEVEEKREEVRKAETVVEPPAPADATAEGYEINPKPKDAPLDTPVEEPKAEEPKVEAPPDPDAEIEKLLEDVPNVPAAENFKKLRTKLRETARTAIEVKEANARLEATLQKYTTGEVLPEVLLEKENEIQRLSRYEKLHSLKTSKAYQEAFVKPLDSLQSRIGALAADYDIPKEEVSGFVAEALSITKQSDLNRFLADHFDDVGALEVKQLINQTRDLQTKAKEAENEPGKALDALMEEHRRIEEFRDAERKSKVSSMSRDTWADSLLKIREEGQVPELILKDNDPEHNDTYVRPILSAASQEYAKLVNLLAENGLQHLSHDLGYALARMVQLAHASAISIRSRNEALKHAEEIERNTRRTSNMVRPPIGSSGGGSGAMPQAKAPTSPAAAADAILKGVMRK